MSPDGSLPLPRGKVEERVPVALAAIVLAGLLLVPLLLVDVPPLLDYPNHLARLFLLARGAEDPVLAPMFVPSWAIIPNLAIDAIGPPLVRVLPVHVAGRIVLALTLLLPFAGALAYSRAVFGRLHLWSLAVALIAFNAGFLLGFMNFVIGTGAALLLAAAWIAWRDRYPAATIALAPLGMAAIFFCHLMGVLFALLLIGAHELVRAAADRSFLRRAVAALPLLVIPALLYRASALSTEAPGIDYLSVGQKLDQLLWPFTTYSRTLDVLTAYAVGIFLIGAAFARRLHAPPATLIALAALAVLYVATPYGFKGTLSLDTRFTLMFALLLFAGLRPDTLSPLAAAGFAGLIAARLALVAVAWHGHVAALAELRQVLAPVAPGDRVFPAEVVPPEAPEWWDHAPLARRLSNGILTDPHLPALALIERRAFWPLLFNEPAQQPIRWAPALQALADRAGGVMWHTALTAAQLCGYDFVLLLDAAADPGWRPPFLSLEVATPTAALYRVKPESGCATGAMSSQGG